MHKWKQKQFERNTFMPCDPFGLDSVQGYLEMALWYDSGHIIFNCNPNEQKKLNSMYFILCQLEKEGHMILNWEPRITSSGEKLLELKQIALTTSGHKLLAELRVKSRWGRLKERLTTILWAVASSIITTLAILALKGS